MDILCMMVDLFLSFYASYMILMLIHALLLVVDDFSQFTNFCPMGIALGDETRRKNIFMNMNACDAINCCILYPLEIYFQWAIKFVNMTLH